MRWLLRFDGSLCSLLRERLETPQKNLARPYSCKRLLEIGNSFFFCGSLNGPPDINRESLNSLGDLGGCNHTYFLKLLKLQIHNMKKSEMRIYFLFGRKGFLHNFPWCFSEFPPILLPSPLIPLQSGCQTSTSKPSLMEGWKTFRPRDAQKMWETLTVVIGGNKSQT